MPPPGRTLFRVINNTAAFIGGDVVSQILKFITALWIVRSLAGEAYGEFSFIYVYLSFFEVLVQFGLNATLTREVSQNRDAAARILGNAILLRLSLCVFAFPLAIGLIRHLGYPLSVQGGVALASLQLFLTLRDILDVLYRVQLRMIYPTLWNVSRALLNLVFVLAVFFLRPTMMSFIAAYLVSGLLTSLAFAIFTRRFIRLDFHPDFSLMGRLVKQSAPLLLSGYLTLIYYRTDVFMLSKMKGFLDVGYYSVATRLTEALDIIPASLLVSLFPILSHSFKENRRHFEQAFSGGFKGMLLVALPIAMGGSLIAEELTVLLFGAHYAPSAVTLKILLWYLVFSFTGCLLANLLIACGKQVIDAWISLAQVIVNIGLNFILIPRYSYNGAAVATVIGAAAGVVACSFYAMTNRQIRIPVPGREFREALVLNAPFLGLLLIFKYFLDLSPLPYILLGILCYGLLLLSFRVVRWEQIKNYLSHWKRESVG